MKLLQALLSILLLPLKLIQKVSPQKGKNDNQPPQQPKK